MIFASPLGLDRSDSVLLLVGVAEPEESFDVDFCGAGVGYGS